ncbi:MAG: Gfo/Idh/MocA family oxidoreductase [Verrucomicrobiales bacterium]|nr:Gfo/Idh/MocA family oxidoreductase [Verrucomicrobiales bacterium]
MNQNRRKFIKTAAAATVVGPNIIINTPGRAAPSERLTLGFVGVGGRGMANLGGLMNHGDTQVLGACDVDELHWGKNIKRGGRSYGRMAAKEVVNAHYSKKGNTDYKGCDIYSDYRELCSRNDIDAVCVSTPDHWHALATLAALQNGKDVYCEKPVTHYFAEGQAVYKEVAKQKAIFQTGSQQRSAGNFHQGVTLMHNGVLGKIKEVKVGLPRGHDNPDGDANPTDPPSNLDYEFWTGPAKMLPYMRARNHWSWRWHTAYGGGQLMDWIGHHNDINHWGLGLDKGGPLSVQARGWTKPKTDVYDSAVEYEVVCEYEGGIQSSIGSVNPMGTKWIGENGWLYVNRGKIEASNPEWLKKDFKAGDKVAYKSSNHHRNFIDGCKERKECVAPAETAHRSITPGHIAYVSHAMGDKKLHWDAAKEEIVGDAEAQKALMAVPYRKPWDLG